jgi:cell wall-associated NlpC family hydrolase
MKLNQAWSKRVAVAILSTTIAVSGGFVLTPHTTQAATVSAATRAHQIIALGEHYRGTPYKFGAKSGQTRNFDCSSFTQYIFGRYGIHLPRTAAAQSKMGTYVSRGNWKVGDLLFFTVPGRRGVAHVGVYIGNNKMLQTYGAGGVKITPVNSYWRSHYITARRVIH